MHHGDVDVSWFVWISFANVEVSEDLFPDAVTHTSKGNE